SDDLRVGRLTVIGVAEAPADADDRPRQLVFAQAPAGDIHLMNALVAQIAVAVIPHPVPIVMEAEAMEGRARGRTAPQVVIDRVGNGPFTAGPADAGTAFVAQCPGHLYFPQPARAQKLDRLLNTSAAADLGARLANAVGAAGNFDNPPALAHIMA